MEKEHQKNATGNTRELDRKERQIAKRGGGANLDGGSKLGVKREDKLKHTRSTKQMEKLHSIEKGLYNLYDFVIPIKP